MLLYLAYTGDKKKKTLSRDSLTSELSFTAGIQIGMFLSLENAYYIHSLNYKYAQ